MTAEEEGREYKKTKPVWLTNDDGLIVAHQQPQRIKRWYWKADNGTWYMELLYGNSVIDIDRGRTAIEVGRHREIKKVIETLIAATENGELDFSLNKALVKRKEQLKK